MQFLDRWFERGWFCRRSRDEMVMIGEYRPRLQVTLKFLQNVLERSLQ